MPNIAGLQFQYVGPSSSFSFINGQTTSSITYNYLVTAQHDGEFTIPGIGKPTSFNTYELLSWGPTFTGMGGIRSIEPPLIGPSYTMFVPKANADGLDIAGVRPIQIRVPLGTSTGWNVRNAAHRPQDSLCALTGTYVPFATTLAQRLASGDPRPSLQERYTDHAGFVYAVMVAAKQLVLARFLLPEDFYKYVQGAAASSVLKP